MVRIGILLTYPKQELKKGELLTCQDREWTKSAPKEFVFERNRDLQQTKSGKHGIPTDVAVGTYITNVCNFRDVEVDFILPADVSMKRLASNDLNFLMIYDVLEAYHCDKSVDKHTFNSLKKCLMEAKNIYPPRKYQEFIYSKINYYNYLKENDVSIAPTLTMTTEEYKKLGHDAALKTVLAKIESEQFGRFIAKPVYGQEGKDCQFFEPSHVKSLGKYFSRCMNKYPGIVVQKAIKDFGNTFKSPELRMYYMGNKYKYSVCATRTSCKIPVEEGGTLKTPLEELKATTRKILRKLPPIVMQNGARLPRMITRLDMGYMRDGVFDPFVNEVEFVPSFYAEIIPKDAMEDYIKECAKQMVRITRLYKSSRRARTSSSSKKGLRSTTARRVKKWHVTKRMQSAGA